MAGTANETGRRGYAAPPSVAGWLGLVATPTFAVMALVASMSSQDMDMMCAAAHSMSPLSGMVPMYVLMSAFHSAPWLRLIARWRYFSVARGCSHESVGYDG